ncbi:MAG: hypothetical protein AAB499_01755 [Patescibacteria group bacterium]
MGKNASLRKLRSQATRLADQSLIRHRRREQLAGANRIIKRMILTVGLTMVVMYLGLIVNGQLPSLVTRLKSGG